jgi:hypothetical protein
MSGLIDQLERDRFVQEQGKNISVIAPAGVGKTTSIVNRIVHLAQLPEEQAIDRLSRLIVVTYSVRAAQQMQQKARVAIRAAKVPARVQRAFQQTFFGTIHSYCVRLLDRFGHYLGLPSPVGLLQDDTELWNRFLLRGLGQGTQDENLRELFHFYAPEKLYALAKEISPGEQIRIVPVPELDWKRLFDFRDNALHAATKKNLERSVGEGRTLPPSAEVPRFGKSRGVCGNLGGDLCSAARVAAPRRAGLWASGGQCVREVPTLGSDDDLRRSGASGVARLESTGGATGTGRGEAERPVGRGAGY